MAQNAILQKLIDEENEDLEIYQDEHEDYEDDFDWLTIDYDEAPYLNHHHHTNTSSTSTPPSKSSTLNNKETQVSPERQQHVDDDDYHYEQPSQLAIRHRLSKKVIMKAARKGRKQSGSRVGIIVITWANYHYLDFVQNWVYHVKKSGCKSYLVGAMDDELLQAMLDAGVPTFAMSSGLTKGDFGWGSPTFNKMGREKISLLQTFTHWNQPVIISDVDTVWIQNPLKFAKNVRVCLFVCQVCNQLSISILPSDDDLYCVVALVAVRRRRDPCLVRPPFTHNQRWWTRKMARCHVCCQHRNHVCQTICS